VGTARNQELFERYPIPKAVSQMALPTIISQLIILIYSMADTFYLGRVNNPYMVAGAALILPVFNICASIAGLAGIGGGSQISRLLGQKREEEAQKVSAFSLYLAIAISFAFGISTLLLMTPLLRILGASEATFSYARQYAICVIVLGGVPNVLCSVMAQLLRSTGESRRAGFGVAMGGLLNIALDPLFMFVLLPKGQEVLAAGIATLLSTCVACTYFFCVIFRLRRRQASVVTFSLRGGLPTGRSIRVIFAVGIPSSITTLLFDLDYVVIDKLMSGYGDVALAAVGIVLKAERLPLNVGLGICHGMMPILAYNYSAKNYKRMIDARRFSLGVGIAVSAVSTCLYQLFAPGIMRVFIENPETVLLGTQFLRIRSLATPFMFLSFFTVFVFQGLGKGNYSLFLGIVRWACFNIPMLFLLNRLIGMYGLVWAQLCADVLTVTISFYIYYRFARRALRESQAEAEPLQT
jgi:putative MATE family efflux protein